MPTNNESGQLFESPAAPKPAPAVTFAEDTAAGLRLKHPVRDQVEAFPPVLDDALARDHRARVIWLLVLGLDLSAFDRGIGSRGGNAGAPAIDPRILLCLWVYATCEGIGSARELARLCRMHLAYRWICGGVDVSAHVLSDFRTKNGDRFVDLMVQVVAAAMSEGLVDLSRIGQDGTRVRVWAGADSFRREPTLVELEKTAREHLEQVLREADDPRLSAVRRAAIERGARDRADRVQRAIAQLPEVLATRKRNGDDLEKKPPRVSTTDPQARVMKMGDGGFRPACNVQFAENVDGEMSLIVGVSVTNSGSDQGQATPMRRDVARRYEQMPKEHLVDGGFVSNDALDEAAADGSRLLAPLKKPRKGQAPPEQPRPGDSPAVREWRQRMSTDEAKKAYRQRAPTCERPHADGKAHRNLETFPVRGLTAAHSCAALFALSFDLLALVPIVLAGIRG